MDHQFRVELPGGSRLLRRGFPLALHAGRAGRIGAAGCVRGSRWSCWRRTSSATEFKDGKNTASRPLPYITVADPACPAAADELWAWAHVHFNQSLAANPRRAASRPT